MNSLPLKLQCTIVFHKTINAIQAKNPDGSRKYRYIIHRGSSRSSKTASIIQVCDWYARTNRTKRITAWRDTKKDCKDTVLNDAIKYMKMWHIYKVNQDFNKTESIFTYNTTDSTFEIHGTDDEEKVMGLNKAVAWLNEPYKISRETFDQLDQRTEDFVIVDLNPKKGHWSDDLEKDPRAIVIHSTFKDNPFCPVEQKIKILGYQPVSRCYLVESKQLTEQEAKTYDVIGNPVNFEGKLIKELIRCRENEAKNTANNFNWSVYGLGEKSERPNRIFHWEEISVEQYRQIDVTRYYGVDWGTVDPWGIVEAKYLDGRLYLRELNYASENEIRQKLTPTELAQIAAGDTEEERRNQDSGGIVSWLFTKLGIPKQAEIICDTNRPLKGGALRRSGWTRTMPAVKAPGSIIDGIDLLNKLKVYYTSDSPNLKYEQENYSYAVDRYGMVMEEPEDSNNHTLDGCRYIAQYLFSRGIIRGV